ncbi:MAG: hypothetical protein DHS20C21_07560 [Gemmatimonadota bacterium]|nr:MAG: hypothetical protein DHS20C21_07560 [Gemmatimonadota bacterium]
MNWWVGTSGYSYKEWKGPFYPEKLAAKDMLTFYAQHLTAVEINNTFYRSPKTSVLEGWAGQVGPDFRFVLKANRRITHFSRLKESAAEPTGYFLRTATALAERQGPILFQLPPNMKADPELLGEFLEQIPEGTKAAFEFRHDTWFTDDVYERLRGKQLALCLADTDDGDDPVLVPTADYGYLRLRKVAYDDEALRAWVARVRDAGWEDAYVFFKHEDEATGPLLAARFLELARG